MPELAPVRKTFLDPLVVIFPTAQCEADIGAAEAARIVQRDTRRIGNRFCNNGHDGTGGIELGDVRGNRGEFFLQRKDPDKAIPCVS